MKKTFKEYLLESKQTYEFKIKLVGEHDKDASEKIKKALEMHCVESISEPKTSPIQESQVDFPSQQNVSVTIFDACLAYPATSVQVRNLISAALNLSEDCVKVRSDRDEDEHEINHEHDQKTGKALIGTPYDKENNQDIVGDNHVMSLLKELNKTKHQGEQYKGVNDKILAKKAPSEKVATVKVDKKIGTMSTVGSRKIDKPTIANTRK
jgi:hypothetical protein